MATATTATGGEPLAARRGEALSQRRARVNVGDKERWLSALGGGALTLYGLGRGALGGALALLGGSLLYRGLTGRCPAYRALGISTAAGPEAGVPVERVVTIGRPREELFRFWRDLENLPRFMQHLSSVQVTDRAHSRWVAKGPLEVEVAWEAEIHDEQENERIAWRSLPGSSVETSGAVYFSPAPKGRGTEVRVSLEYRPPAGKAGAAIAWLFGRAPGQEIAEDLRRFKQLMEAGEVPTTRGQTSCRR